MDLTQAREFAYNNTNTRQEWRRAILGASQVETFTASNGDRPDPFTCTLRDYLLAHSPYSTISGVRAAETKALNQALAVVREIVAIHDEMAGCYFWTPRGNRAQRDEYAEERTNGIVFFHKGRRVKVEQDTTCSAKNVYYSLGVWVDGVKKDVRVLRKIAM